MDREHISPGYYPDPENPGVERWWNGQGWSDTRRYPGEGGQDDSSFRDSASSAPLASPDTAWAKTAQSFTEAVDDSSGAQSGVGNSTTGSASMSIPRFSVATPPRTTPNIVLVKGGWGWRAAIFTFMSFVGAFILSIATMVVIGALNTKSDDPSAFSVEGTPAFIFFVAGVVAFFSLIGAVPAGIIAGFVMRKPSNR